MLNDGFETLHLGGGDVATEARETIVAPALIIERRIGPFVRFRDQAVGQQSPKHRVEAAGANLHISARAAAHLFDNGIAMLIAVGKRHQDVKDQR